MRIDISGRVTDFIEKPKTPEALTAPAPTPNGSSCFGIAHRGRSYLASMGIYLSRTDRFARPTPGGRHGNRFRHEIFPNAIKTLRVQTHLFDGYWEDIGTVGAFHKANIDLTTDNPPFDFTFGDSPVFTRPRYLPCSRIAGATVDHSLIADGCLIGKGSSDSKTP